MHYKNMRKEGFHTQILGDEYEKDPETFSLSEIKEKYDL